MYISSTNLPQVIKGLEQATDKSIAIFTKNCKVDKNLMMLSSARRIRNGIRFSTVDVTYDIESYAGIQKRYYTITSRHDRRIIYDNIALFESAMGLVRALSSKTSQIQCRRIIELDGKYDSNMIEAYALRYRLANDEVTDLFDIYEAKMLIAFDRAKELKRTILRTI